MQNQFIELASVQVLAEGEGFLIECRDHEQRPQRLRLPSWALYQLMRALPRVEAAMHQAHGEATTAIMAHAVVDWCVERTGLDQDVAVCLRTDRDVESGFSFDLNSAMAFHRELGDAIARAAARPSGTPPVAAVGRHGVALQVNEAAFGEGNA